MHVWPRAWGLAWQDYVNVVGSPRMAHLVETQKIERIGAMVKVCFVREWALPVCPLGVYGAPAYPSCFAWQVVVGGEMRRLCAVSVGVLPNHLH
jgi:hypothetical protein